MRARKFLYDMPAAALPQPREAKKARTAHKTKTCSWRYRHGHNSHRPTRSVVWGNDDSRHHKRTNTKCGWPAQKFSTDARRRRSNCSRGGTNQCATNDAGFSGGKQPRQAKSRSVVLETRIFQVGHLSVLCPRSYIARQSSQCAPANDRRGRRWYVHRSQHTNPAPRPKADLGF